MKKRLLLSLIISIYLISAQASRVVHVGAFNYYPAIFKDADGEINGFYVDMLSEIGHLEDIEFQYVYGSWSEGLLRLQNGQIDIMPSVAYLPERALVMDYASESLLTVWGELYVTHASEIKGVMDTRNLTIAVMKGDVNARHFINLSKDFGLNCQFAEYSDFTEVFRAIATGAADAGVVNNSFGAPKYREFGLKATGIVFNPFDIFFATKKGENADILTITDKYLSRWKYQESSVYNTARQKWSHGTIGIIEVFPQWLLITLAIFLLSIIVSSVFIYLLKLQVNRATSVIRESETKLRSYIDNAPDGVFVIDINGKIIEVNPSFCLMSGLDIQESVGLSISEFIFHNNIIDFNKWLHDVKTVSPFTYEGQLIARNPRKLWVIIESVHLTDARFLVFVKNISNKKEYETELMDRAAKIEEQIEELSIAKARAEESDSLKNAFLQNLNHEIRTPLNAIMGFSELLPVVVSGNKKAEEYCRYIVQRSNDLLEIINGTLLIASIESGQMVFETGTIRLDKLISDLETEFDALQLRYNKENVNFVISSESSVEIIVLETDIYKLKLILTNLLSNACKFTFEGSVLISIKLISNNKISFSIQDTGVGIEPNFQEHIFSRFYKITDEKVPMYDGAGLGLPIAKSLVSLLGGKLEVQSEYGKGSTFSFILPCAQIIGSQPIENALPRDNKLPKSVCPDVLVVEDDLYNMLFIKQLLEHWGIKIVAATTGKHGIQLALEHDIKLILMDIKLPDMTGYEAISQIKQVKPELPIIVQTGFSSQEDAQLAFKNGCSEYISKPISLPELNSLLHRYLDF